MAAEAPARQITAINTSSSITKSPPPSSSLSSSSSSTTAIAIATTSTSKGSLLTYSPACACGATDDTAMPPQLAPPQNGPSQREWRRFHTCSQAAIIGVIPQSNTFRCPAGLAWVLVAEALRSNYGTTWLALAGIYSSAALPRLTCQKPHRTQAHTCCSAKPSSAIHYLTRTRTQAYDVREYR